MKILRFNSFTCQLSFHHVNPFGNTTEMFGTKFDDDCSIEIQNVHQQLIQQYTIVTHNVNSTLQYSFAGLVFADSSLYDWCIPVNWFVRNDQHYLGNKDYRFSQILFPFYCWHKDTLELKPFLLPDLVNIVTSYRTEMQLKNEKNTDVIEEIVQNLRKQGVQITKK